MEIVAEVRRGELIESYHWGSVAIVDSDGNLRYFHGKPLMYIHTRSSMKPFQALLPFITGAIEKFDITDEELAVITASHNGTDYHKELVLGILEKAGFTEDDLECGVHMPYDKETAERMMRNGEKPTPVRNNCSGKHAGMLISAKAMGVDHKGYRFPNHPVQNKIREIIRTFVGNKPIYEGIDGCGVPVFAIPLRDLAYMYAMLADPEKSPYPQYLARIQRAMKSYPVAVAGEGRFDTDLMRKVPGVVAKAGAEAVYGVAIPQLKMGLAIKIHDAGRRAVAPTVMHALDTLGILTKDMKDALRDWVMPPVKNNHGETVGHVHAVYSLKEV